MKLLVSGLFVFVALLSSCDETITLEKRRQEAAGVLFTAYANDYQEAEQAGHDLQMLCSGLVHTGWDALRDREVIAAMRVAWLRASLAQFRAEGTADLLNVQGSATNSDDFLVPGVFRATYYEAAIAEHPDPDPFDALGFVGAMAVERILYADTIRREMVVYELALPGALEPSFPRDAMQSTRFCNDLVGDWVAELNAKAARWQAEDPSAWTIDQQLRLGQRVWPSEGEAFDGMCQGKGPAIYSGTELQHLRARLDSRTRNLELQRTWIEAVPAGREVLAELYGAQSRVMMVYDQLPGQALPLALGQPTLDAATAVAREEQRQMLVMQIAILTFAGGYGTVAYFESTLLDLLRSYEKEEKASMPEL